ncbi:MAG: hypothetical protein U0Y10_01265 [Spirosomataceae bacterium]
MLTYDKWEVLLDQKRNDLALGQKLAYPVGINPTKNRNFQPIL